MYTISLPKPDGSGTEAILTEIVDGFCIKCGNDTLWNSLLKLEPERESRSGVPTRYCPEPCSRCLSTNIVGIWRDSTPTGSECRNCGKIELPKPLMRIYKRFRLELRLTRMRLFIEQRQLEALLQKWIMKDPFAPR
jgi:hypothetical protein